MSEGGPLLYGSILLGSALLSLVLTPLALRLAIRRQLFDLPAEHKGHRSPVPYLGGLAIVSSFVFVVAAAAFLRPPQDGLDELLPILAVGLVLSLVGFVDDVRSLSPLLRLGVEIGAGVVVWTTGVGVELFAHDAVNAVFTVVWVVGITNAFNLLDNMDGLSAGVALVASATLFINAWVLGEFFISLILLAFMGALLGFLRYNFQPASVFLGDCGSLFIGYVMASLTLLERYVSNASSTLFPVLMPVVVLAVPITDTATVMWIRFREKRPLYVGDARHLSHRLVSLGYSHRSAVLFLYLTTFCLGLGAASLMHASLWQSVMILVQTCGFVALILILMYRERRRTPRETAQEPARESAA